jgi:enoyl-CoA hydratase/carnithine racemase
MNDDHNPERTSMSGTSAVILEQRGAAFWITLNRPEKRNALDERWHP